VLLYHITTRWRTTIRDRGRSSVALTSTVVLPIVASLMDEERRPNSVDTADGPGASGRRQRLVLLTAIALFAIGAVYAALAISVRVDTIFFPGNHLALPGPLARIPGLDSDLPADSALTDRINILILGLDRRPHHTVEEDGPPRSDSMYVLSIDPVGKTAGLLAIPRDLYVEIPDPHGKGDPWISRINTAYPYGIQYKYPGGGPALARATVERTLKIAINYHIVIDWVSFADVIDALGGIDITAPAPLQQVEAFNVRDFNAFTINIAAGRQHMDSITALAYARYRGDEGGDLSRIKRQQQVMQAAMDRALSLGWLATAPTLWNRFRGAIDTDISTARLPGMIALARQIGVDRITMASLAGDNGEAVREALTIYGEDVLLPVWDKIVPIVQSVIYDRRLREEGAQVKVINATATRGQAARTAAYLTRFGLSPTDVTASDLTGAPERRPDTAVIDYTGKEYTAGRIAEWLGLPRSAVQNQPAATRNPGDPDVVVVAGQNLKIPTDDAITAVIAR
jgi:LCP family protein required for cell wall assembly